MFFVGLGAIAQTPSPSKSPNPARNAGDIQFVKIAPGEFTMGCSDGDNDCTAEEKPAHRVQITKAFEIGKYEVTQAQWQAAMGSNPSTIKGEDRPVETVSKNDVHEFLAKLNARNDGYKYRLPTEAEWEYAARAGTTGAQPWPLNEGSLDEIAWYGDNSKDETHPVGQKKPNAWGLYDMLGNVREWVEDVYGRYTDALAVDPTGAQVQAGGGRGGRGGRGGFRPQQNGPPQQNAGNGGRRGGNFGRGGQPRQLPIMRGGGWDNNASFRTRIRRATTTTALP